MSTMSRTVPSRLVLELVHDHASNATNPNKHLIVAPPLDRDIMITNSQHDAFCGKSVYAAGVRHQIAIEVLDIWKDDSICKECIEVAKVKDLVDT